MNLVEDLFFREQLNVGAKRRKSERKVVVKSFFLFFFFYIGKT